MLNEGVRRAWRRASLCISMLVAAALAWPALASADLTARGTCVVHNPAAGTSTWTVDAENTDGVIDTLQVSARSQNGR